jgi:hypothetical protein
LGSSPKPSVFSRITDVLEDREQGTRFETEPFTGYE